MRAGMGLSLSLSLLHLLAGGAGGDPRTENRGLCWAGCEGTTGGLAGQ